MKKIRDIFNPLVEQGQAFVRSAQKFVTENPIKVYAMTYGSGNLPLTIGALTTDNFVLATAAGSFLCVDVMKICFGTGGMWDDQVEKPSWQSIKSFFCEVAENIGRLVKSDYRQELYEEMTRIDWDRVNTKTRHAWNIRKNPFDAGCLLWVCSGTGFILDGVNAFAHRPDGPAPLIAVTGAFCVLGSAVSYLTEKNHLAAPLFSCCTTALLGSAVQDLATGEVANRMGEFLGIVVSLPFYYTADYMVGRVKTEHQSLTHGR